MSYYKLEAKYPYTNKYGKKRTKIYKYWYRSINGVLNQMKYDLSLGGKIAISEISEQEYTKATTIRD
jgi:cytoplasmic iron level regulating protein YaaA (DUF328/UPF0246 family)